MSGSVVSLQTDVLRHDKNVSFRRKACGRQNGRSAGKRSDVVRGPPGKLQGQQIIADLGGGAGAGGGYHGGIHGHEPIPGQGVQVGQQGVR